MQGFSEQEILDELDHCSSLEQVRRSTQRVEMVIASTERYITGGFIASAELYIRLAYACDLVGINLNPSDMVKSQQYDRKAEEYYRIAIIKADPTFARKIQGKLLKFCAMRSDRLGQAEEMGKELLQTNPNDDFTITTLLHAYVRGRYYDRIKNVIRYLKPRDLDSFDKILLNNLLEGCVLCDYSMSAKRIYEHMALRFKEETPEMQRIKSIARTRGMDILFASTAQYLSTLPTPWRYGRPAPTADAARAISRGARG